jgi:hypothetical protein
MSSERAFVVGLPDDTENGALVADISSAAARSRKADPGDRLDIARFEALATRLEQLAANDAHAPKIEVAVPVLAAESLLFGSNRDVWSRALPTEVLDAAAAMISVGRLPVLVLQPLTIGITPQFHPVQADEPARRWDSGGKLGRRAVEARFRAQIEEALSGTAARRAAISPSGIQNPVVTEILREFAEQVSGTSRADVPVEYRDGSRAAHPFPLRALPLKTQFPVASSELRFALLSIRHAEMDAVVHGAWLRNAEVSRPRPAAQTDDLVYDISRRQLAELCRLEDHVRLYMYQTGLETAVVGFYKALTDHLLAHPGSVSVQPMYYESAANPARIRQLPRSSRPAPQRADLLAATTPPAPVVAESAPFRRGTPWAM